MDDSTTLEQFLIRLNSDPESIDFEDSMAIIGAHYIFTPTAFRNGDQNNSAEENQGSCKIFAFASLHQLNPEQTLACFGRFYRQEVLRQPEADNHRNIRNFMRSGWEGISFSGSALSPKS